MTNPPRSGRLRSTDASSLKLHLTTLLSVIYLVAWWAFDMGGTKTTEDAGPAANAESGAERPIIVWYDALPPIERPKLILPPGVQLATLGPASIGATLPDLPARPVRVTSKRPGRVRTRSS